MESITVKQFIAFWIPNHIKNKILQYLLESIVDDKYQIVSFRFGDKKYSTKTTKYLKNFLPFRKEGFVVRKNLPSYTVFNSINQCNQNFCTRKRMMTFITENDISKIKNFVKEMNSKMRSSRLEKDPDKIRTYTNSKNVNTDTIHSVEYVNKTELVNFNCCLTLNEQQLIYAYHSLYNNGAKSKFSLYNKSFYKIVSISPVQMLWRIRCGHALMKDLKELAKINKIVGRSKLKTRHDYIVAFMAL